MSKYYPRLNSLSLSGKKRTRINAAFTSLSPFLAHKHPSSRLHSENTVGVANHRWRATCIEPDVFHSHLPPRVTQTPLGPPPPFPITETLLIILQGQPNCTTFHEALIHKNEGKRTLHPRGSEKLNLFFAPLACVLPSPSSAVSSTTPQLTIVLQIVVD